MSLAIFILGASLAFGQIPFPGPGRAPTSSGGITYTGKTCVGYNANPLTCTWSSAPAAGENVYCSNQDENGSSTYAFTDSAANSYTNNGSIQDTSGSGGTFVQFAYFANLPGTITTTTVTGSGGSPLRMILQCFTVTGGNASPVDGSIGANRTTGTSVSTTVSPAASASVLFSFMWNSDGGATNTPGSGFTLVDTSTSVYKVSIAYKISSTSGSNTCDWTSSASVLIYVSCQAYK